MIFAKFVFADMAAFLAAAQGIMPIDFVVEDQNIQGIDCSITHGIRVEVTPAVYNELGEEVTPAVLSDKYHVDICFGDSYGDAVADLPAELAPFEVFPEPTGQHSFVAMEYLYEARYNARGGS